MIDVILAHIFLNLTDGRPEECTDETLVKAFCGIKSMDRRLRDARWNADKYRIDQCDEFLKSFDSALKVFLNPETEDDVMLTDTTSES